MGARKKVEPEKVEPLERRLRSGRHGMDAKDVADHQRARLLDAISVVVAKNGYVASSVDAIVAEAGTSKRTFYELFESKEDCFLQAYDVYAVDLFTSIASSMDPEGAPEERARHAILGLVRGVIERPEASTAFLVEIGATGKKVLDRRAMFFEQFAERYVAWRRESRETNPKLPELTKFRALTSVLSVTEVISLKARRDGIESVAELTDEIVELAMWFTRAGEELSD